MLTVKNVVLGCACFVTSPFLLIVGLMLFPFYLIFVAFNLLKAGRFEPMQTMKLIAEVVKHAWFMISHVPLFLGVWWYYIFTAPSQGMKGAIPFPYSNGGKVCKLDVYTHRDGKPRDVVMFVYGGAWGSGHRWYYSKLAAVIRAACDAIVVVPEYPTHPSATIYEQTECIHAAATWCDEHMNRFGGNGKLWLVGHSAGAHLIANLLVRSAMAMSCGTGHVPQVCSMRGQCDPAINLFGVKRDGPHAGATPPTRPIVEFGTLPRIAGAVLICGVYDLVKHLEFERNRGVDLISPMTPATDGYWEAVSPTLLLRSLPPKDCPDSPERPGSGSGSARLFGTPSMSLNQSMFPQLGIHLVHAAYDKTVDVQQSLDFRDALVTRGASLVSKVHRIDCSHSDVVIGPIVHSPTGATTMHPAVAAIARAMTASIYDEQRR